MFRAIRQSIRYKMILVVLAINLASLLATGVAFVIYDLRNYRTFWVNDLVTQSDILGRASAAALQFNDPKSADAYLALLKARPLILAAAVFNAKGKLFAKYTRSDADSTPFPGLPGEDGARVAENKIVLFKRIVEGNEILGTVYLRAHYPLYERVVSYLGILATVLAVSLIAAFLKFAWLKKIVVEPILAVAGVAREVMDKRDYSLRVKKTTDDEIGYLVGAFNDMLAEIGSRDEVNDAANRKLEHEIAQRLRTEDKLRELNLALEQRVADRTVQLESANKELESFSYSVSHDLRAPLRFITGFSGLLIHDHGKELNAEALRKLDIIRSEATRMGALIDDLLAFSRLGRKALQITELDMTELAQVAYDHVNELSLGSPAELRLGSLPRGRGDRALCGQVWANLLSNAIKYTAKREKPVIEVNAITDDKEHIYFVRDNGAGFDPRYQSKLFEVFQRLHDATEFPGTGIGLALVRRIVARHGGRVWAESKLDAGATFYFTLPKERSDERV